MQKKNKRLRKFCVNDFFANIFTKYFFANFGEGETGNYCSFMAKAMCFYLKHYTIHI